MRRLLKAVGLSKDIRRHNLAKKVTLGLACLAGLSLIGLNFFELWEPTPEIPDQASSSLPNDGDKPTCDESLQSIVDAAATGDTVEAPGGCVYRETITIKKALTLKAGPGAEIRGSDVWTGWTRSGSYWVKGSVPSFSAHGECRPGTRRCHWPEQVFFDGAPLSQVASNPASGQFAVDSDRNLVLADDPDGHIVEVTVRRHWIVGESENVTVEGFRMKHAANDAQTGAITNRPMYPGYGYSYWVVQDNVLSAAHGAAVFLVGRTNLAVLRNDVSEAGQLGIGGGGTNIRVEDNRLYNNNTEDFDPNWEAGGMKLASNAEDLSIYGNESFNNRGNGLWCDLCTEAVFENNRVYHNERSGILYEISDSAKIRNNVVWENGWGRPEWNLGSGIMVSNSRDVEVYDNVVAWNADGIGVINADRGNESWNNVADIYIHDNNILAGDDSDSETSNLALSWIGWQDRVFDPSSNNRGATNKYWYPAPENSSVRFFWNQEGYSKVEDFNLTPGEESGAYLSDAEKEDIVSWAQIPPSPEPHCTARQQAT